ncbi:MAG: flagellar hook-length control protein FliK [Candidatus Kapabacteria bacterium]|nr:flagellar hook-length control protein FliK [Candidatus Kapabacteria bacterium]
MAAGAEQKVSIEVKSVENQTVTEKPATEPITDDLPKVAAGGLKLKKKEIISDNKARTIVESSDLKSEEKPIKNDQSLKNQVEENLVPSESIAATLTVVPQTVSQMNQIDDLLANNGEQNPENTYEPIPYQKFQKAIVDQQNAYLGFSGSKRISGGILTNKLSGSVNDLTNVGQNISNDETDQITKNKDPKAVINKNNLNSIPQELRTDQGISNINNPINDSKKLILTDNKNLNFGTILPFDKDVIKIKINTLNGNKSSVAADNDLNLLFNLTQRNSKSINIIDPKILGNSPDSLINLNENSFVKSSIDQPPAEHNSLSININLLKKELANQNNSTESVLIDNTVKNIDNLKFEQLSQTSIQSQDKAIDQLLGQTKTNKDNSDSIINPTIKLLGSESSNLDDNINLIKKDGEYSSFKNQTDYSNKNDSTEQNKNFEIKPDINLIKLNELSNSAKGQSISLATGKNPAPNVKEYLKDDKSNDYKIITKTDQSAEPSKNQSKNESNTNFFKNEQGRSLEQPNPLDNIVNKEDIKNSQDGKIEKIIVNNQENTVRINLNELNNTIRSYASSMTNGTSYQAKIILNPESLGTVFVEMSLKGNVVDINIKAETKEAVMNIRQQINDLKEKLAGNGLQSDKIEVELKDSWQDESNSKNRRNGLSQDDEKARKDFVKSFQNLKEENK